MIRAMLIAAAASLGLGAFATAEDKPAGKDVTVTGTLVCAKCKLSVEGVKECTNALQVKEGDKTVTYFLKDEGNGEEYHQCGTGEKPGVTVAGTLTETDGKKFLKPTKVTVAKK